jgi:peptidyl-prolyl cis-trans isomerase B (cyclophilin B)
VFRLLASLLCLIAIGLAACGDDEESGSSESSSGSGGDSSIPGSVPPSEETESEQPAEPEQSTQGGCRQVEQPPAKPDGGAERSAARLDPGTTYVVVMKTSCGSFRFQLDQKVSPRTAASFANLVRTGFFDDTVFHRIVPGFVIQGGDPTGTGTGGPGYSTRDVPPQDARYVKGTVAMAKSPVEPPGTSGSQFYVVTAPDAGLPPEYALLGRVIQGQNVVDRIGELGDPASGGAGTPVQPVVIESTRLIER